MDVECVVSAPIEEALTIVHCANGLYLGSVVLTQNGGRVGTVTCTNVASGCARLMGIHISPDVRFSRGETFVCETELTGSAAALLLCPVPIR